MSSTCIASPPTFTHYERRTFSKMLNTQRGEKILSCLLTALGPGSGLSYRDTEPQLGRWCMPGKPRLEKPPVISVDTKAKPACFMYSCEYQQCGEKWESSEHDCCHQRCFEVNLRRQGPTAPEDQASNGSLVAHYIQSSPPAITDRVKWYLAPLIRTLMTGDGLLHYQQIKFERKWDLTERPSCLFADNSVQFRLTP